MKKTIIYYALIVSIFFALNLNAKSPRKIVFEEFTEVWCGPCASISPMLEKWLESKPNVIPIMYTSYFNNNGEKQNVTKQDYQARNTFYNVPFYPYARVGGNSVAPNPNWPGYPTDTSAINSIIDTMSTTSPVSISINFENNGQTGNVDVSVVSDVNLNDKRLFVFILEKEHEYIPQSNGMTYYHDIFRETVSSPIGQIVSLEAGIEQNFNFEYVIEDYVNTDLYAIALLQDNIDKYIYNCERVFAYPTSVNEDDFSRNVQISPNPVFDNIYLDIDNEINYVKSIEIIDLTGSIVFSKSINSSIQNISLPTSHLSSGVYYLKLLSEKKCYIRKFINN